MANTEIFLRNIFGTTRPNIRPLVLALNITNDLLFEQHISMSDIKATKHIYPDVARLLHKKPETVYKSVIRLAHRCWDALVEQDLVLSYLGRSMKQEPDPSVFITYLAVYIQSDIPFFEFIERDPGFLFRDSPDIFGMSDIPPESTTKLLLRNKPLLVSQAMAFTSPAGLTTFPVCPACMATLEREGQKTKYWLLSFFLSHIIFDAYGYPTKQPGFFSSNQVGFNKKVASHYCVRQPFRYSIWSLIQYRSSVSSFVPSAIPMNISASSFCSNWN